MIGSSAGGTQALQEIAGGLPAELPASVLVARHTSPTGPGLLPDILARAGALPAKLAEDGEPIERGQIYVAPPDHHMVVGAGALLVSRGPRENGHRPAIDPLFRSAARHYGQRVIAVVLSGGLDDGTGGLRAVTARGGVAIVQDPQDALNDAMPTNAIQGDSPSHVVPAQDMAGLICSLVEERLAPVRLVAESSVAQPEGGHDSMRSSRAVRAAEGSPVGLICPECGGPMFDRQDGELIAFECLVGHRYTGASFDGEQACRLEATLWAAVRSLLERGMLLRRLAERARLGESGRLAGRYEETSQTCDEFAAAIRTAIDRLGSHSEGELPAPRKATGRGLSHP